MLLPDREALAFLILARAAARVVSGGDLASRMKTAAEVFGDVDAEGDDRADAAEEAAGVALEMLKAAGLEKAVEIPHVVAEAVRLANTIGRVGATPSLEPQADEPTPAPEPAVSVYSDREVVESILTAAGGKGWTCEGDGLTKAAQVFADARVVAVKKAATDAGHELAELRNVIADVETGFVNVGDLAPAYVARTCLDFVVAALTRAGLR